MSVGYHVHDLFHKVHTISDKRPSGQLEEIQEPWRQLENSIRDHRMPPVQTAGVRIHRIVRSVRWAMMAVKRNVGRQRKTSPDVGEVLDVEEFRLVRAWLGPLLALADGVVSRVDAAGDGIGGRRTDDGSVARVVRGDHFVGACGVGRDAGFRRRLTGDGGLRELDSPLNFSEFHQQVRHLDVVVARVRQLLQNALQLIR